MTTTKSVINIVEEVLSSDSSSSVTIDDCVAVFKGLVTGQIQTTDPNTQKDTSTELLQTIVALRPDVLNKLKTTEELKAYCQWSNNSEYLHLAQVKLFWTQK